MAFTFCTNCGKRLDESLDKCPYCGHPKGAERTYYNSVPGDNKGIDGSNETNGTNGINGTNETNGTNGSNGSSENPGQCGQNPDPNNPYGQNPNNPYGRNPNNPYGRNPNNPYGQGSYTPPPYGGPFNRPVQQRPISVGLLVFSIINIVIGCCCAGSVFGILSLIFTIGARNAATDEEEIRKKKTALVLNIVGIVLTVLVIAAYYVALLNGLVDSDLRFYY